VPLVGPWRREKSHSSCEATVKEAAAEYCHSKPSHNSTPTVPSVG